MSKHKIVYTLQFTFEDLMDMDGELTQEFNKLDETEQEEFISANSSAIVNGMNDGTDYSTVMKIVANLMAEELLRINKVKTK